MQNTTVQEAVDRATDFRAKHLGYLLDVMAKEATVREATVQETAERVPDFGLGS